MSRRPQKPLVVVPLVGLGGALGGTHERRKTPRFPFTATAEIVDIGSQTRVFGRSSDLGTDGCYIDTISPFAVGAVVRVKVARGTEEFEARAMVKYALLSMGMGLAFTEIKPEHQIVLNKWLAELRGERSPEPEVVTPPPQIELAPVPDNMRQVVIDLITLMMRKNVITETEANGLLKRIPH